MKLLLVEDEAELSSILAKGLRKCGYAVDTAYDGEDALFCYKVNEYDLIILDLNLPKIDGLEVLQQIRGQDMAAKILILSARSSIEERVYGLDLGANDYLVKPFDFLELEARVRMLLRTSFFQNPAVMSCGIIQIDTLAKSISAGTVIFSFTKKEYSILEYLMQNKNIVISAEQLIEHVWDSEVDLFSNALKYHVHAIRKKLENVSECAELLHTIRGHGYMLAEVC